MRRFSLVATLMLCAATAQAEGSDAWSGTAAQGQIEGYVVSEDGAAELATGCSLEEKGDRSGLGIFISKTPAVGHVMISVDNAAPMEFDLVQGTVDARDPGRDELFNAMISGSRAEVTMMDGTVHAFSLKKSGIYLKPCL